MIQEQIFDSETPTTSSHRTPTTSLLNPSADPIVLVEEKISYFPTEITNWVSDVGYYYHYYLRITNSLSLTLTLLHTFPPIHTMSPLARDLSLFSVKSQVTCNIQSELFALAYLGCIMVIFVYDIGQSIFMTRTQSHKQILA